MAYQMIQTMDQTTTPSESEDEEVDLATHYIQQFGSAESEEEISAIERKYLSYAG